MLQEHADLERATAGGTAGGPADAPPTGFTPLTRDQALALWPDVWLAPAWQEHDQERADWLISQLDGTQLGGLLGALLTHAAGGDAHDLLAVPGMAYSRSGIPVALKHLAMLCRKAERRPLWDYADGRYTVNDVAAALFTSASPPLAAPASHATG